MSCNSSPYDFELNQGLICIFRGYEWPFEQKITQHHHDLFTKIYTKKRLIRKCTHHYRNFEMIGRRCSKQSTGTTFCETQNGNLHQYFRNSMNTSLLPYVRSMINVLREEALFTNYSSGECLMKFYQKILKKNKFWIYASKQS